MSAAVHRGLSLRTASTPRNISSAETAEIHTFRLDSLLKLIIYLKKQRGSEKDVFCFFLG